MSDDGLCIRFQDVGKHYIRRHLDAMLLRDILPGARERSVSEEFWALRHLDIEVAPGETVAILGQNGSGKSTMLSLVAGASLPSEGQLSVRGRVAPVLGIGVGFEPDLSAVENAYINASLLGIGQEQLSTLLPAILEFADLGEFVDTPVRHYSSGMVARLGFAVAVSVERDIVLVDEVLAVGDQAFQHRCLERFRELQSGGVTLLFATHDLGTARELCDRGIWLREGTVEYDAPVDECIERYEQFLAERG